jgi:tRNA threonylcarbamoyladenosine biosynthesis protein TsaB
MILRGFFKRMKSLFVDTTDHFSIGLLSSDWEWIDYSYSTEIKSSAGKVHSFIHNLLEEHGLTMRDIKRIFFLNGPGSYTGVRVSEGMAQVFSWLSLETFSFYHHDVPKLLGTKKGHFVTPAFKKEVFSFSWDEEEEKQELVGEEDLESYIKSNDLIECPYFFIKPSSLNNASQKSEVIYTTDLIKKYSKEIFPKVFGKKLRRKPFYFRSLEKEFRPSY